MKYENIADTIGNTPIVRVKSLGEEVWLKLERANPGLSIKDRIAKAMIDDAIATGALKKGSIIVEPTSGNTGIALAMIAASYGYRIILTMPESMSIERRKVMAALGAQIVLTPKEKGMKGAIDKALEIANNTSGSFIPMQFENPSNPEIHRKTTAQEIAKDFPNGIDYLVAGVGTGGHLTGCGEVLKELYPNLKLIAVEPTDSPVLSGGEPGPHAIQGIGAGFIPKNCNTSIIDKVITITKEEAFEGVRFLASNEGILCGISTGANIAAIKKIVDEGAEGKKILSFSYDIGDRYLSVEDLF